MWIGLVCGFLAIALATADDAVAGAPKVQQPSDSNLPPDLMTAFGGKVPPAEQLIELLDSMTDVPEEDKASLREELLQSIRDGGGIFASPVPSNDPTMQTVVLLSLLGVVALIFVFFVYKLLKVLSDRKAKREEKKKNKQQKKKK